MDFQVSVIIPVYNAERWIKRAVHSVLPLREVGEIILVEDGSPDNALAICHQLAAQHPDRIRLFRHPNGENKGPGPSRNRGIKEARCPYIAFLDADDYYLPIRFKKDAEILLADPSIDGVYNALGVDLSDPVGAKLWEKSYVRSNLTTIRGTHPPERLFFEISPIGIKGYFSLDGLTLRRHALQGLPFSSLPLSQDTLFILQLVAIRQLAPGITDRPVALRGVHSENRIHNKTGLRIARTTVLEKLATWARDQQLSKAHNRAISQTLLQTAHDWSDIINLFRSDPLLLHPTTLFPLFCWFAIRMFPEDPILPGFLPKLRKPAPPKQMASD